MVGDHDRDDDTILEAGGAVGSQRLDKWLWYARVIKSRTQASDLVSAGGVRVNRQRVVKPSVAVKAGDVLTISVHSSVRILEVVLAGTRRGPAAEAQALYKDLTPPPPPKAEGDASKPSGEREAGSGRPTKRDRRRIISFTDNH
jgi:ribosome-associated heat shock protein Hsp15